MKKILGLSLYGPIAASNRYRLGLYKDRLYSNGIHLEINGLLQDDYFRSRFANNKIPVRIVFDSIVKRLAYLINRIDEYDGCIIHYELLPLFPFWIEKFFLKKIPFIYDFDDAFFLKYQSNNYILIRSMLKNKCPEIISHAAAVTAGNRNLQEYAMQYNKNTVYIPTVVDMSVYTLRQGASNKIRTRYIIGWIGSPSTTKYLKIIEKPLQRISKLFTVKLRIIGGASIDLQDIDYEILPWHEVEEIEMIKSFDVGVMPIPDEPWSKGKCAFKLIQCMACGVPVIGSRVGANFDLLAKNFPQMLASTEDEWVEALHTIFSNGNTYDEKLRGHIYSNYSLESTAPIMAEAINSFLVKQ